MKRTAVILCLAAIAVCAQLKDVYANYFRFGSILNQTTVSQDAMKSLVLSEFNSITPENELKPDKTIVCNGSTNTNIQVTLNSAAAILKFCQTNGIPVRGHTLVWHSQSPTCFFKDNFQDGGNWVTPEIMNLRMESYIKNLFEAIAAQYPNLNLYAYDVVNEAAKPGNPTGPRNPGTGDDDSKWVQIYGDNSFVEKAFEYARKYAPETTKLFYNDFNEYENPKRDYIINSIVKPLFEAGLLDGMGLQSHLDARSGSDAYPSITLYKQALDAYKALGVELQVTELDVTVNNSDLTAQAEYYKSIMEAIISNGGDAVTAVVVWGIQDDQSWRKDNHPLLFNNSGAKKEAYNKIYGLIPREEWGDGDNVGNKNGIYTVTTNAKPTGSGVITRSPAFSKYAEDAEVTLTAKPSMGWKFKKWSGDVCSDQASAKITMNSDKNVTAHFVLSTEPDYNIIKSGDFSRIADWTLNKWQNSVGDIAVSEGEATITMTTAPSGEGAGVHSFQLVQNGIPIIKGYTYKLTFNASATAARDIGIVFQKDVEKWDTYSEKNISLTTTNASHEFVFKMDSTTDDNGRIAFNIGGATPTVKLSNVRLVYAAAPEESGGDDDGECDEPGDPGDPSHIALGKPPLTHFSVQPLSGKVLLIDANSPTTVEIYNLKGNKVANFNVLRGSQKVNLSLPSGMYFAKAKGAKVTKFMLK